MSDRQRMESTLRSVLELHEVDIRKRDDIIKNIMETFDKYVKGVN